MRATECTDLSFGQRRAKNFQPNTMGTLSKRFSRFPQESASVLNSGHQQMGASSNSSTKREQITYSSRPIDYCEYQQQEAHRQLDTDTEHSFNIAFCGEMKPNKSRLINVLRGSSGELKNAVLWDVPAYNPTSKNYFYENKLCAMDLLVIMNESGFDDRREELAERACAFGLLVVFVCTKCNGKLVADCENEKVTEDGKCLFVEAHKSNFKATMTPDLLKIPHFLIGENGVCDQQRNTQFSLDEEELGRYLAKALKQNLDQEEQMRIKL